MAEKNGQPAASQRLAYLDALRLFALFGIVILHVSSPLWLTIDGNWWIYNIYRALINWALPMFVVISGANFIGRDVDLHKLYTKNIPRLLAAFFLWSAVYLLAEHGWQPMETEDYFIDFFSGHYHLWFIFLMVCLYMVTPLFQAIRQKGLMKYFLILGVIWGFLPEIVTALSGISSWAGFKWMQLMISTWFAEDVTHMVTGYLFYYALGYGLKNYDFKVWQRITIYLAGLASFVAGYFFTLVKTGESQVVVKDFYSYFCAFTLVEIVAVFVFFRYTVKRPSKLLSLLAEACFGAYLVHVLIQEYMLYYLHINGATWGTGFGIFWASLVVYGVALAISLVLNRIPIVKKYFV